MEVNSRPYSKNHCSKVSWRQTQDGSELRMFISQSEGVRSLILFRLMECWDFWTFCKWLLHLRDFWPFAFLCTFFITIKLKEQKYHQQWLHTTTQCINMPVSWWIKLAQVLEVSRSVDPFTVSSSLELSSSSLSVCHSMSNRASMSPFVVVGTGGRYHSCTRSCNVTVGK